MQAVGNELMTVPQYSYPEIFHDITIGNNSGTYPRSHSDQLRAMLTVDE